MQQLQVRVAILSSSASGWTRVVLDSAAAGLGAMVSVVLVMTLPFRRKRLISQWLSSWQSTPVLTQDWHRSKSPSSQMLQW